MPIRRAVLALAVPTVISQLVVLVYSMADTWFVGQTGDPRQVAAVTVCYPLFLLLNAIANLFGIGGGSLISRLLGGREPKRAGIVASFTLWAAGGLALCYSGLSFLFGSQILTALGADAGTFGYARNYLFWTVSVGALPTVLGLVLANLIRAEGGAKTASLGMSLGGVLNVVLDPIFIFLLDMEVGGAALATALSNTVSVLFLLGCYIKSRRQSAVKAALLPRRIERNSIKSLLSIGTPAALQILLSAVSGAVLLGLMGGYETAVLSGVGVMQKVEVIPFQIAQGVSSGVLPLIAYSFAAGNRARMRQAIRFAMGLELAVTLTLFALFEGFAPALVGFFVPDAGTVAYGAVFLRLRCLGLPFITVEFLLIAVFQAIGGAKQAFALSLLRKGILDLPLMYLAQRLWAVNGLILVQPVMECAGAVIALVLYRALNREGATSLPEQSAPQALEPSHSFSHSVT